MSNGVRTEGGRGRVYLIVNFGGPRDLGEVEEFLVSLLTDQEVIQSPFPPFWHRWLFTRVAKKRALVVGKDYAAIGGKSPIFEDTERVAEGLRGRLGGSVMTFHRYLPKTHARFLEELGRVECEEIVVFPLFPQFSYATTGSIALFFAKNLEREVLNKLRWVQSYPTHPLYVKAFEEVIRETLFVHGLLEEKTILLFSAHGLPKSYVDKGDIYEKECQKTFASLAPLFPKALSRLCYQSQFGKKEWLRPYTHELCPQASFWGKGYEHIVVVPLSFTSDHIETLFEIEELYLPVLRKAGFQAIRCPALNLREQWLDAIAQIIQHTPHTSNASLCRQTPWRKMLLRR